MDRVGGQGAVDATSGSRDHQGVVLKTTLYPYAEFTELLSVPKMLLDNVEDPHNVEAIPQRGGIWIYLGVPAQKGRAGGVSVRRQGEHRRRSS